MADIALQGGSEGSVEFDESAASGAVESRLSVLRTLVEDLNNSGETRFTRDLTVDGRIWRVAVEQLPG